MLQSSGVSAEVIVGERDVFTNDASAVRNEERLKVGGTRAIILSRGACAEAPQDIKRRSMFSPDKKRARERESSVRVQ